MTVVNYDESAAAALNKKFGNAKILTFHKLMAQSQEALFKYGKVSGISKSSDYFY
jgi:hypothetical protein